MKNISSKNLYELNLPKEFSDLRGKVPLTMSARAYEERFLATRDELPTEVTVLAPLDTDAYPESRRLEIFVSPDGDDAAAGTEAAPVATLAEAVSRVKGKGGATVTVGEGVYSLTEAVTLTAEHSGTASSPLILRAKAGETVTLTANTAFSTDRALWRVADPATDPVAARLPAVARGKVLSTTIAEQGLTPDDMAAITAGARGSAPRLFVGGEEYVLARYPNKAATIHELLYFTVPYDSGTVKARDGSDLYWTWIERANRDFGGDPLHNVGWQLRLLNGLDNYENAQGSIRPDPTAEERAQFLLSWVNTGNIWYYGSVFEGWEFGYYNLALRTEGKEFCHYAEDDTDRKTPLLGAFVPDENGPYTYGGQRGYYSLKSVEHSIYGCKHSGNSPAGRNTFYLFNAIEALDEPGEWFFDVDTGILYVYPKDEAAFYGATMGYSGKAEYAPLTAKGLSYAIIDGIGIDGSNGNGIELHECENVVLQHLTVTNTKDRGLLALDCTRTAILYSDFSAAYTHMLALEGRHRVRHLIPTDNIVQNCFFHDAKPTRQIAISLGDCRAVISHNYFRNTCMNASAAGECIIEYNRFEGGSADVVDGGMYYASGTHCRGNHIRYNLFHMFNETHNAVYNDTMNAGNYAYYNVVSTLGSRCNHHKGWYSSTGMGNVCFGNVMVLRDPWEVARAKSVAGDEDEKVAVGVGDNINQSALFYYYFGKEHAAVPNRRYDFVVEGREELYRMDYGPAGEHAMASQSLAGHWWEGMKASELKTYLEEGDVEARTRRDPAYINHLYGTRLILDALDNSEYRIKYFYLPAKWTGRTYTSTAAPAGTELLIPEYVYLGEDYEPITVPSHTVTVPASGEITLAYEEIAAMERLRRAPAFCVIKNNVLLGGTPFMDEERKNRIGDVDPAAMINDGPAKEWYFNGEEWTTRCSLGYIPTSDEAHNYLRYEYETVMQDPRSHNYRIRPEIRAEVAAALDPAEADTVLSATYERTGPTYGFDYEALGPVQSLA